MLKWIKENKATAALLALTAVSLPSGISGAQEFYNMNHAADKPNILAFTGVYGLVSMMDDAAQAAPDSEPLAALLVLRDTLAMPGNMAGAVLVYTKNAIV